MGHTLTWEIVFEKPNQGNGIRELTARAKVDGGWIYRHLNQFSGGNDVKLVESMVFVPSAGARSEVNVRDLHQ